MPEDDGLQVLWRIEFHRRSVSSIRDQRSRAESCLLRLLGRPPGTTVGRDESGAPTVTDESGRGSLSHVPGVVSAAWSRSGYKVGIDIESDASVKRLPETAWHAWMTPYERLLTARDPRCRTVLWAAKEAAAKALDQPFSPAILQVSMITEEGLIEAQNKRDGVRLRGRWGYHWHDAYVLLSDAPVNAIQIPDPLHGTPSSAIPTTWEGHRMVTSG